MKNIMLEKNNRIMNKTDTYVYIYYIWWEQTNIKTDYIIINAAVLVFFLHLLGYWLSYNNEEAPNFNGSSNVDICIFFT